VGGGTYNQPSMGSRLTSWLGVMGAPLTFAGPKARVQREARVSFVCEFENYTSSK